MKTEWHFQQFDYVLSYNDLPKENQTEQISFYYTVYYLITGSLEVSFNKKSHILEAKQFILISPTKPYLINQIKGNLFNIKIKPELIYELATKLNLEWSVGEIFFLEEIIRDESLGFLCQKLISESTSQKIGYNLVLDTLITQVAIELLRKWLRIRQNPQLEFSRVGLVDRRLRRAIEYIHTHYSQEIVLSEIAQAAFLSEYHFAHLFKKLLGITPNNYLIAVRIEQAKKLLVETDHSILDVSLAVGYSSQSHFTKIFRTFTGLTPVRYREKLLNKKLNLG